MWMIFGFAGAYLYLMEEKYWRIALFAAIGIAYLVKIIQDRRVAYNSDHQ